MMMKKPSETDSPVRPVATLDLARTLTGAPAAASAPCVRDAKMLAQSHTSMIGATNVHQITMSSSTTSSALSAPHTHMARSFEAALAANTITVTKEIIHRNHPNGRTSVKRFSHTRIRRPEWLEQLHLQNFVLAHPRF